MQSVDVGGVKVPWACKPENIVPSPSRVGDPNYVPEGGGAFRVAEKRYAGRAASGGAKRRRNGHSQVDMTNVVDFSDLSNNTDANRAQIVDVTGKFSKAGFLSEYFDAGAKMYGITAVEGLYVIPNPFTAEQQRYWVRRCVKEFCVGNPTNLSNLQAIETGTSTFWQDWQLEKMEGLRWASLGYHYQWTPRVYTEEHRGNFPSDLFGLVSDAASLLGHSDMRAEAAIINYYPTTKCMMGGHLDDAEEAMEKPIVSCSFGNTIIFLIGGRTRDVEPTAIYVRSGDIVMMAGNARYCFHGVPKMIPDTVPSFLTSFDPHLDSNDELWDSDIAQYMKDARVNMNVRQVRISPRSPAPTSSSAYPPASSPSITPNTSSSSNS